MSDEIRLRGLRVTGHHGVFDFEQRDGQEFVIDATLGVDTAAAGASDDLADTVDYGALAGDLAAIVAGPAYDLIEALAHRLCECALGYDGVRWAEITVHKPQAPIRHEFDDVSVTVRRESG